MRPFPPLPLPPRHQLRMITAAQTLAPMVPVLTRLMDTPVLVASVGKGGIATKTLTSVLLERIIVMTTTPHVPTPLVVLPVHATQGLLETESPAMIPTSAL